MEEVLVSRPMTWSSGHRPGSGGLAQQFPAFQLSSADVQPGSLKVLAQSPSGRTQQLGVSIDPTGQYTTDFVPNEIGDWTISILSDNVNISGSPFHVRVYDPGQVRVHGLEGGSMGRPINFAVDTSSAGEGSLRVEVTYNGRSVPANVSRNGNDYSVHFNPIGAGMYTVRVFYAAVEVAGSPYTVEIVNSGSVTMSGEGLTSAKVNKRTFFTVNMGQNGNATAADINVRIMSPRGLPVPSQIIPIGGADYRVEFTPSEIGEHRIEVSCYGQLVQGCPYVCQVFNWNQISVSNMPSKSLLGRTVSFDIDAEDSPNGKLEILVNNGKVPCTVENQSGGRHFTGTFQPPEVGVYTVQMKFNGSTVSGSPWKINVYSSDHVRIEGAGRNCVHVNTVTGFDVLTSPCDGQVNVVVKSPSGRTVTANISKTSSETYHVEFTPTETGPHDVTVTYEGMRVNGSPFVVTACNPNAVLVTSVRCVTLGNTVEYTGPGELDVAVNRGAIPSTSKLLRPSVYAISYLPPTAGKYLTDIKFNGVTLPESPLATLVIDVAAVQIVSAPTISRVGRPATVRVDTQGAGGEATLGALITSPSSQTVQSRVSGSMNGCYEIEFTPTEPGPFRVDIDYAGVRIPHCPIIVMAYDVSRIRVLGVVDGLVGQQSAFSVGLQDCGEGELEVVIMSSQGRPILNQVMALEPGRLEATYTPVEGGVHFAEVTFNKEHVPGSPFKFNVYDPSRVTARGEGLSLVQCNQRAAFVVTAPGAKLGNLDICIRSPNGRDILPNITETNGSNFRVDYTPTLTGIYEVCVNYFGQPITGSPFEVKSWDASKVLVTGITRGNVGIESSFNIELGEAGDGTVEISIMDPNGQLIPNQVNTKGPGLLQVNYIPNTSGDHRVNVIFNGLKVTGCPMTVNVLDASKVSARGEGLDLVQVNCQTAFMVRAPDAKQRDLDIKVIGPNGAELLTNITETSACNFKVSYTPNVVGSYQIPITYCGTMISGSPFTARAWDNSKVLLADVSMGQVGVLSSFRVIASEAGEGVVEISITDPIGQLVANQASPLEPGVILVSFIPLVVGVHRGAVLFNKQKIPASPFTVLVIDPSKVTVQGQGLGLVPVRKQTSVVVNAPGAQRKDIDVRVTGADGQDLSVNIHELNPNSFKVDYTPMLAGDYCIEVCYFGKALPSGQWRTKAYDISKVMVGNIGLGRVGRDTTFPVDMRDAGEGRLEIGILGPMGQTVENSVSPVGRAPGMFQVMCVPTMCGPHKACVRFNDEDVAGSPFTFIVTDPNATSASGEGLQSVKCGKMTSFTVKAPAAQTRNLSVKITGPRMKDIACRLNETSPGLFHVDYTPTMPGEYLIEVNYFDQPILDSPFTAIAWDSGLVQVNNIKSGIIGKPTCFNINASEAGPGNLEVAITSRGESVRNVARKVDSTGLIEVSYTPIYIDPHIISVRFNGEHVNGSPFVATMMDGSQATAQGAGLGRCLANQMTQFDVITRAVGGEADLQVYIASPSGQHVPCNISGSFSSNFRVEYKPVEAGRHVINAVCAGMDIKGSPFYPEVYDPAQVQVTRTQCGVVGKPVNFRVDTTMAGQGRVTVDVRGERTQPSVDIAPAVNCIYMVSFVPLEGAIHHIVVKFNDSDVPCCPFTCNVIDQKNLQVSWDAVRQIPVGRPAMVELDSTSSPQSTVTCTIVDSFARPVSTKQRTSGSVYSFGFIPMTVGPHTIDLKYGCEAAPGSPFICNVYDVNRVRIIDATSTGNIGQEVGFTVDTSEAGLGNLETVITCCNAGVPVRRQQMSADKCRFAFVAKSPADHIIELTFNGEPVPGTPLVWRIVNPASKMSLSNVTGAKSVAIGQLVCALVNNPGYPITSTDINAKVIAPTGDILPTRINQLPDGSLRVEYTSMYAGTHQLMADYAGQMIPGSPLLTEIFDPNKINIEGARIGEVNVLMTVNVNCASAGVADLGVTITDPHGSTVAYDAEKISSGQRISYVPLEPGAYRVHVTFGGMDVPGCPIRQDIRASIPVTAVGDGLVKGIVGTVSTFCVDPKGQKGELLAVVQGPNTQARIQIEPEQGGRLKINYMPAEVGIFTIGLQFNGREVDGCPFHPRIIDPTKVEVIDDWKLWSGPDRLKVKLNDMKTIEFSVQCAGPGQLTATIDGPDGMINPDVLPIGMDGYALKFVPRQEGDYYIRCYWSGLPITKFPIIATAEAPATPAPPPDPTVIVVECDVPAPPPPAPTCDASKLIVTGPGLIAARVSEPAQFIIDGQMAGPGMPGVKVCGVQEDLECSIERIGECVYGCTYIPTKPGAYLLSVMWCDQYTPRSPYKITVLSNSDVSKVVCTGDGLRCGMLGQALIAMVDTRRAGPGEVLARCDGPTRPAVCDIEDRRDGMYELHIRPQEVGQHLVYITFGGEQVPGSPFHLKVHAGPDASKVIVSGEGIRNGILATYQSNFTVDTRGAGQGQLTVKVRAKKGTFRVEMSRSSESERLIQCRYNPTEIGEYFIHIQWSGQHVPRSPFRVFVVDTVQELRGLESSSSSSDFDPVYGGRGGRTGSQFGTMSNLGGGGGIDFTDEF